MLRFLMWYMIVGQVLNWFSVFFVVWSKLHKCKGRDDVLEQIHELERGYNADARRDSCNDRTLYRAWCYLETAVLWPRTVIYMMYLRSDLMKAADALLQAETD